MTQPFNLDSVACSPEAIDQGTLVEIYPGWRWRVRSSLSRIFERGYAEARRRIAELDGGLTDEERDQRSEEILAEFYARYAVLGWEPVERDGSPLEYSPDVAEGLLRDRAFPDLSGRLARACSNLINFRAKAEAVRKND